MSQVGMTCRHSGNALPEPVEQRLRGNGTHPSRILRDHGDGRFEQVREHEVVEADQRDLVMLSEVAARGSPRS